MDDENKVYNNLETRKKFNSLLRKIRQKEHKDNTINKWFTKLSKLELLLPVEGFKGYYQINPLFFHNGTDTKDEMDRKELIKKNLESIYINKTNL